MWYTRQVKYPGIPMSETYVGIQVEPHPRQVLMIKATEDVVGFGGAAGGGKSEGILIKGTKRCEAEPGLQVVAFRKQHSDAVNPGAIWPRAQELTIPAGWTANGARMSVSHPYNGSTLTIGHLKNPTSYLNWQGSEIDMLMFDELTHFTAEEFHYMRSRLRNTDGRMTQTVFTTNPEPDSWVKDLLAPWVDEKHEWHPMDPDVVLYVELGEAADECTHYREPGPRRFSLRFIPSRLTDNPSLGPEYTAQLESLPRKFREALLAGDWNVIIKAGLYFSTENLPPPPPELPQYDIVMSARAWDTAGGRRPGQGDFTAGTLMRRYNWDGTPHFNIENVWRQRITAGQIEDVIVRQALLDGPDVLVVLEQEGASQSAAWQIAIRRRLQELGIRSITLKPQVNKGKRAMPMSVASEKGLMSVGTQGHHRDKWRRPMINEYVTFPETDHDDMLDSGAMAFIVCSREPGDYSYWSASS